MVYPGIVDNLPIKKKQHLYGQFFLLLYLFFNRQIQCTIHDTLQC